MNIDPTTTGARPHRHAAERAPARDPRLAALVERLEQAGRRFAWRVFLEVVTAGLLVALGVLCGLQSLYALLGDLAPALLVPVPDWLAAWRPAPLPEELMTAAGIGVAGVATAPIVALLRRPSVAFMARAADRHFALDECASTAVEVGSPDTRYSGTIREALLESVAARAAEIDPRRLVPIIFPRTAAGVPVLIVAAALLSVASPPPLLRDALSIFRVGIGANATPADFALTEQERAEGAADLAVVAAVLRRDGREHADAELQALAQEAGALGRRLATGPAIGRKALGEDIERLMRATHDAYGRAGEGDGVPQNLAQLLGATAADTAAKRPAPGAAGGGPRLEQGATNQPGNPIPATKSNNAGPDGLADPIRPPQTAGAPLGKGAVGEARTATAPEDAAAKNVDLRDMPADAGEQAGGDVLGGAGGGTPGDYAGFGTRALRGEAMARLGLDANGEMLLQNPLGEGGRRIRLELTPDPGRAGTAATGNAPAAPGGWRAANEHEVTRTALPATARDLVGRYFQGMTAEHDR